MRVLILSASIGEGHDLPTRVRRLVLDSSRFHSKWGNRIFDLSYRLITHVPPTRWFGAKLTQWLAARPPGPYSVGGVLVR